MECRKEGMFEGEQGILKAGRKYETNERNERKKKEGDKRKKEGRKVGGKEGGKEGRKEAGKPSRKPTNFQDFNL